MATRKLLADLCQAWGGPAGHRRSSNRSAASSGAPGSRRRELRSRGARPVAIGELAAAGHVVAKARRRSPLRSAIAVRAACRVPTSARGRGAAAGARRPAHRLLHWAERNSLLLKLFERWGVAERLRERLVQAPPGAPVAALLASGRAELGFQQLSELRDEPGIELLGTLPAARAIVTTFVGAVGIRSARFDAAAALLAFMTSPAAAEIKRRHGMSDAPRREAADSFLDLA
jgi:molybdate transport system substrate-binding protein